MTPEEVQKLTGAELDLAVARAMGKLEPFIANNGCNICYESSKKPKSIYAELLTKHFSPSTNWAQGGPLIEELVKDGWVLHYNPKWKHYCINATGIELTMRTFVTAPTILEAACRAYVLAKGE